MSPGNVRLAPFRPRIRCAPKHRPSCRVPSGPMSWSTAADIATTLGTLVALTGVFVMSIIAIRSERLTRRGQQIGLEQAEATASRTESAAALTEEYTRRLVDAVETMASRPMTGNGSVALPAPRVRWSLLHHAGDTYRLENEGDLTAEDVELSSDTSLPLTNVPESRSIGPGEAVTFMASARLGTRDRTITVTWMNEGYNERRTWRYPLPGRPPRR
jgi:hypothetical protein